MAGRKGLADPVAAASEAAKPRKSTKAKAAQHAESLGMVAPVVKRIDGSGTALVGRPSVMTEDVCAVILERMSRGETLTRICDDDPEMPDRSTVMRHFERDAHFASAFLRARVLWAIAQADVILDIADDASRDWEEKKTFGGATEMRPNREVVDRSKLKIETRKWLMERFGKMLFSQDAAKITPNDAGSADDIRKDATVITPDEPGPPKPVL